MHTQTANTPSPSPTILYDADCGFCIWMVAMLLRTDRRGDIGTATIQSARHRQLASIADDRVLRSWHVATADGVSSAGAGLTALLSEMRWSRPIAAVLRRLPGFAERLYRLIADRRATFARLIPERHKAAARQTVARRARATEEF
jgi:predicted DCC family thiol-disulfide oxidoreductase YuxK